ncbi:DUF4276 family protein [Desulfococcaceae bacterium HSG8]|nr:DUF4276 family protein [Desulfococcaceae bacterium HSG8]
MRRIILFVEDYGHEAFITALIRRVAHENRIQVKIVNRSVRGGHGKVITEFQNYLRDMHREREGLPDLLIVATDANCKGYGDRRKEIDEKNTEFKEFTICAIPDPHIERWLLLDSSAFKTVLGKGCDAPAYKCSRDRYKKLLLQAMQNAGIVPPLGGLEYAQDIINAMNFKRAAKTDCSFKKLFDELVRKFKEWKRE